MHLLISLLIAVPAQVSGWEALGGKEITLMDELIPVKGCLSLNKGDYDHLVFIPEDTTVVQI